MAINQEPRGRLTDSETFVESVLSNRFEMREEGLADMETVEFLAQAVKGLSGDGVKVISLVGGAASGKSTMTRALVGELAKEGTRADSIGTDDFNRGDRAWRWEHFEGDNPEPPIEKYDFGFMNQKIGAIRQISDENTVVAVPTYDQATGLAIAAGEENYTHKIGKIDVLFVEGDFHPVENPDLVVYLHMQDGQRLQNRISRDLALRAGGDPDKITSSFNFRHQIQHIPYTLPVIGQADIVLRTRAAGEVWLYDIYEASNPGISGVAA